MTKPGRFGSAWEKFQEIFLAPPEAIAGCLTPPDEIELRLSPHML
jgi:hypothetical protein